MVVGPVAPARQGEEKADCGSTGFQLSPRSVRDLVLKEQGRGPQSGTPDIMGSEQGNTVLDGKEYKLSSKTKTRARHCDGQI